MRLSEVVRWVVLKARNGGKMAPNHLLPPPCPSADRRQPCVQETVKGGQDRQQTSGTNPGTLDINSQKRPHGGFQWHLQICQSNGQRLPQHRNIHNHRLPEHRPTWKLIQFYLQRRGTSICSVNLPAILCLVEQLQTPPDLSRPYQQSCHYRQLQHPYYL